MPGCPLRRTCARPLEGACTSRSKAEGELTLGLMSGGNQKRMGFPVGAGLPAKIVWATRSFRQPSLSLTSIASKLAPTREMHVCSEHTRSTVGAGLLAMASVQSTNRCLTLRHRQQAGSYRGMCKHRKLVRQPQCGSVHTSEEPGRLAGRLVFAFAVHAPSRGRVEVLRSGHRGKDAAVAAPGHGWPMAAGPRSRTGARAWRALASHRTTGARALGYLGLFQVTRCKSETASRHHRRNGYAPSAQCPPTTI